MTSPVLATRCSLVVADDGSCVVIDAGALVAQTVLAMVDERGLRPQAVLVTHGHADHTWDTGRLAQQLGVTVVVHAADLYRLHDPLGTLGELGEPAGSTGRPAGPLATELRRLGADPTVYTPPVDVRLVGADGASEEWLELGGIRLLARHAPGHTEGSTVYLLDPEGERPVAFTGDVLFAGTVGRTDLPGGDLAEMTRTLRTVIATLPPSTVVLPGHGPATDIATELARNPYLR